MGTKKQSGPYFSLAWLPAILAICLYINTIPNKYCLDDTLVVCNNRYVHEGLQGIPKILTTNFFNGFNNYNDGLYRPLPVLTYAIEYSLWGMNPGFSHLINILLYALTGYFLFLLLKRVLPKSSVLLALSISLLFIAHPVHTEVVSNIKGRDDLLAFLFSVLASYYLLLYFDNCKPYFLLISMLVYSLSLLSKESAVMFLFILPVMTLFFRKISLKSLLPIVSSLLTITVIWILWRSYIIHSMSQPVYKGIHTALNNSILSTHDTLARIATSMYFQLLYILKLVNPIFLTHDYSYNQLPVIPAFSVKAIVSFVLVAGLMVYAMLNLKKRRTISFGILFYFITISIVANIFLYIGATFAERFLFTPSLGFSIVTGVLLYKMVKNKQNDKLPITVFSKNIPYTIILLCILLFYSVKTISRNFDWKDNMTLYTADISQSSNSARMHFDYGSGMYAQAIRERSEEKRTALFLHSLAELKEALGIYPDYPDALINTGNVYGSLKQPDSAINCYRRILNIDSTHLEACYNLGYTCYSVSKFSESIIYLKKFLTSYPDNENACFMIGSSYCNLNNFKEAIWFLERCVSLDKRNTDAMVLLGISYEMELQYEKALRVYYELISLYQINGDRQKAEFYRQKYAALQNR
jgi:protein O-mannosyl-transferase